MANPKYPHLAMENLAKEYGEIMSLQLGVHPTGKFSSV
jgi:hypothetical protein